MDPVYAQKLGVNIDELLLSQPDTGEQGLEIAEALVRSGAVDIIVIDSVATLVPKAEIEGDMGDSHVGLQARLMSQALRKLSGAINKSKQLQSLLTKFVKSWGYVRKSTTSCLIEKIKSLPWVSLASDSMLKTL